MVLPLLLHFGGTMGEVVLWLYAIESRLVKDSFKIREI